MQHEEGYICRWDPATGRGAIRASQTPGLELPFSSSDLQLAPLAPRLGMAVVFQRSENRALAIRPWASSLGDAGTGSARRQRRPIFQATGAAPLSGLDDPLSVAKTAKASRTGQEAAAVAGITRPAPLHEASPHGSSLQSLSTPVWPGALALAAYVALLAAGSLRGRNPLILAAIAPLLWLASFAAYWLDKHGARNRSTRDREATLHLIDALGGWPGGWIAMRVLPHKRQRMGFRQRFWVIAVLHSLLLGAWLGFGQN